jgi:Flp pilus assembly protein TadG
MPTQTTRLLPRWAARIRATIHPHPASDGGCVRGARGEADRGSATLEIAILGPALLLLTFGVVQASLDFYANSLAMAAAQAGVTAARAYGAPADAGPTQAHTFLTQHAGDSLRGIGVASAATTPATVRIVVTGQALTVLPGIPAFTITAVAQADRERLTTAGPA